jgi:hypothetical protein
MINIWGPTERSTYHGTCVRKVDRYLNKKCTVAHSERKLVAERITDASGYDAKRKTWYLCEIKVNWSDLQKAPYQIHDTAFRFPRNPFYHKGDTVMPVIALPARLQKELVQHHNWDSLRDQCTKTGIGLWIIEQSGVREITSPNTKGVKTKSARASTAKTKTSRAKKTKSKTRAVKSTKAPQTKTKRTKRRTTKTTRAKSKRAKTKR